MAFTCAFVNTDQKPLREKFCGFWIKEASGVLLVQAMYERWYRYPKEESEVYLAPRDRSILSKVDANGMQICVVEYDFRYTVRSHDPLYPAVFLMLQAQLNLERVAKSLETANEQPQSQQAPAGGNESASGAGLRMA